MSIKRVAENLCLFKCLEGLFLVYEDEIIKVKGLREDVKTAREGVQVKKIRDKIRITAVANVRNKIPKVIVIEVGISGDE
jgi:hypothetical protein